MKKVIGTITTYHGQEHRHLSGYKVRIVAVLKNAAKPDIDVDGPDYAHLDDDQDIARAGGVGIHDRIEVQPWIEKEGRFSFVTSDLKAVDLAAFKRLPKRTTENPPGAPRRVVRRGRRTTRQKKA